VDEQIEKANQKGLRVTVSLPRSCERLIAQEQGTDRHDQGIILVGGLGASYYLYNHANLKHANARISILQSEGMKPYVLPTSRTYTPY